jgi:hypothetical protein
MISNNPILPFALSLFDKTNLNIIPCRNKVPLISWKEYQSKRFSVVQLQNLLARNPDAGLGLVCGYDGVVAVDIDNKFEGKFPAYSPSTNLAQLVFEKVGGVLTPPTCILLKLLDAFDDSFPNLYIEQTPSCGFHILFKVEKPPSKMKLGTYPNGNVAVELQGTGCFVVVAPTSGYKTINSSLFELPIIPEDLFARVLTTAVEIGKHDDDQKINSEVLEKVVQTAKEFGLQIVNETSSFIRIKRFGTSNTCSGTIFKNSGGVWLFSPNVPPFNANEFYPPVEFVAKIKFNSNTKKAADWLGLNTTSNPRKSNAFTDAKEFLLSLGSFRLNVVNKFVELKEYNKTEWKHLNDIEIDKIFTQIREFNIPIAKDNLFSLMRTLAAEYFYHPFREYFEHLPSPIGDPLRDFAELIKTDDEFKPLVYKYLLTFFVSAVAQSLGERGSDTMLILYGPQGTGKTTFLRHLVPPALSEFYTEISLFLVDKDIQMAAATSFLLNIDDLEKLQFKSMGFIKSLLSSTYLYYRPPYGKALEKHWRFATFVGSVNNKEFLQDDTGYRRFLVIPIIKRNLDFLDFDINKIWSFAFDFYKKNGVVYLDEASIGVLNSINSKFEVFNNEAEIVQLIFQPPTNPEKSVFLTRAQIIELIKSIFPRISINPNNVTAALKKMEIEPIHTKRGNFYKLQIIDDYQEHVQNIFLIKRESNAGNF